MYKLHPDVVDTSWLCTFAAKETTPRVLHCLLQVSDAHVQIKVPLFVLPLFQVPKASPASF